MKKIFVIILLFISTITISYGQGDDFSISNKSAIKSFQTAYHYFQANEDAQAKPILYKLVKSFPDFIEAHMLLAMIHASAKDYDLAAKGYRNAINVDPAFDARNYLNLARVLHYNARFKEAKLNLDTLLSGKKLSDYTQKAASELYVNAKFADSCSQNPVPFDPVNLGENINSHLNEYFTCFTADEHTVLFTRRLIDNRSTSGYNEDFYFSYKDESGNWRKAYNIGNVINTVTNEGAPTLSPDGNILIFTVCENFMYGYGQGRKGHGRCDLFFTTKNGDSWTFPRNMGVPINTQRWESQPSISSDGKTIYFVRQDEDRNLNSYNIYSSTLGDDGYWGKPVKLNDNVNTPLVEQSVFIHPDNQTLYFSSNGHPGIGGLDLYVSRKDANGEWGKAVNLGYPINTVNDENSLTVNAKGEIAYFASDRPGGFGGLDIYSFDLYPEARPIPVTYVKGKVFDNFTKKHLDASFELIDLETGETAVLSQSNPGNGEFMVVLPVNRNYALNVSRKGYVFYSDNFSLKEQTDGKPYQLDVPLVPISSVGDTIELKNIFFETAKYNLLPESEVELKKLILFLTQNPTIKIQINGHTDNVGDDNANQILSENRAKAVVDYLISKEIAKERLMYKGFGESIPKHSNETEEGRAKNRRTEFVIVK